LGAFRQFLFGKNQSKEKVIMTNNIVKMPVSVFIKEYLYKDDVGAVCFTRDLYNYTKNVLIESFDTLSEPLLCDDPRSRGFVAGGFARWIFFAHSKIGEDSGFTKDVHPVIGDLTRHMLNYYVTKLYGDIDIFFPNIESKQFFTTNLREADKGLRSVIAHESTFATSWRLANANMCRCSVESKILTQYIAYRTGTPEEVIADFDITNGMIAIDFFTDTVYFEERVPELEKNKTLSLSKQKAHEKNVVDRVFKYVLKHQYESINKDDGSLHFFIKWCHDNLKDNFSEKAEQRAKLGQLVAHSSLIGLKDLPLLMGVVNNLDLDAAKPGLNAPYPEIDVAIKAMKNRNLGRNQPIVNGHMDDQIYWTEENQPKTYNNLSTIFDSF
jgi:hypothetical protein